MRILATVHEDEVINAFVSAERNSPRYGEIVEELLERHAGDARAVLADYRAWGRNEGLFGGWPEHVDWYRAVLSAGEVLDILYINWDWWLRISGGSRRPRDAAARVRAGLVPGVEPDDGDERIARAAATNPELIAVRASEQEPIVLLEGHVRLTAYALFPEHLPEELELYLGESPEMAGWSEY
jgi:hypothetical protein